MFNSWPVALLRRVDKIVLDDGTKGPSPYEGNIESFLTQFWSVRRWRRRTSMKNLVIQGLEMVLENEVAPTRSDGALS